MSASLRCNIENQLSAIIESGQDADLGRQNHQH